MILVIADHFLHYSIIYSYCIFQYVGTRSSYSIIIRMQDQSIEAKQLFLRENILDRGYDAESFMVYCQEKEGSIDIEGWTLQKLTHIVNGFIQSKSKTTFSQQQLDNDDWSQFQVVGTETKQQIPPPQPIVFKDEDWDIFGIQVKKSGAVTETQNIHPTNEPSIQQNHSQPPKVSSLKTKIEIVEEPLNKIVNQGQLKFEFKKIKDLPPLPLIKDVVIMKTQQKFKNLLKGQETIYHLKCLPCGHTLQRRFNDLRKLKTIMHKIYPHIRMPYLEPQGWLVSSSEGKDPEILNKYKYQVIEFFKYILITNETLKKSKIVRIFTGLHEHHNSDIKKYETIPKPKKFSELCLPGNQLSFNQYQSLNPIDKYMNNTQSLVSEIDTQYEKLRKTLETLFYNYDQVMKSLTQVAGIFETLQNSVSKFNMENDHHKDLRIYEGIKEVCMRMKEEVSTHQNIFKFKLQPFFKYEKQNMTTLRQINEIRTKMYYEYQKHNMNNQSQRIKKNEVIDGDISIEEVCKSNKNILRIQNMFWHHYSLEAVKQYWQQLRYKISQKLTMIAYQQLDQENQNLNFWNNIIKQCVSGI